VPRKRTTRNSTLRWALPAELKCDLRLVSRCEYERTRGWWVRVTRLLGGYRRTRLFSDGRYGGRQAALEAALLFRDAALAEAPPPMLKPGRPRRSPAGRIYRGRKTVVRRGKRVFYDVWNAYYFPPGAQHHKTTSYSCVKWGSEEARAKARAWLRQERRLQG
jgi:hypothetical protein